MRLMMMIFNKAFLIFSLALTSFINISYAKTVTVEVSGTGLVKEAAIEQALIQAIRQVNGLEVMSSSKRQTTQLKVNGQKSSNLASENITTMLTKGQVSHYRILDDNCNNEQCDVLLSVDLPIYKSPGLSLNKRRKLVVVPFTGQYGHDFSKNLQTLLVQSRRFAILDREHNSLYQQEKNLLLSSDTPLTEKIHLGRVLGLNYIVTGDVKVNIENFVSRVTLTGESESHFSQTSIINYQVINLATRQIKWQDQATLLSDITSLNSARSISTTITNAIYPLRIVEHSEEGIILNQGGKNIEMGAIYNVYALGKKLIDPYTKEALGREEINVGQVEITRINTKVSYARIIFGSLNNMKKNATLRLAQKKEKKHYMDQPVITNSTVVVLPSGGILLPK